MAAIEHDPYTGDGAGVVPRIPSAEDLGGTAKENDPLYPPDPVTMPTAEEWVAFVRCVVAQAKTTPAMVLSIAFNAGDPYVYGLTCVNADIDSGDIDLTDNATGDTTIEWPADAFPVISGVRPHGLTINDDVTIDEMRAVPVTDGVRVKTLAASSGVDAAFTIVIQGQ